MPSNANGADAKFPPLSNVPPDSLPIDLPRLPPPDLEEQDGGRSRFGEGLGGDNGSGPTHSIPGAYSVGGIGSALPGRTTTNVSTRTQERVTTLPAHVSATGEDLISATLVEGDDREIVVATRMSFFERNWKTIAFIMGMLILVMAVVFSVTLGNRKTTEDDPSALTDEDVRPYCKPCINRRSYTIQALLDVATNDYASKRILPGARQMAESMGVNLVEKNYPKGTSDEQMADDIRAAVASGASVDALIVTIPSEAVASAVRFAAESGMPVFGTNLGTEFAKRLVKDGSLLFFTASDERLGGAMAASAFLEDLAGIVLDENDETNFFNTSQTWQQLAAEKYTNALYISQTPASGMKSFHEERYEGYRDRLLEASNGAITVEWIETNTPAVDWADRCKYQSVLVGTGSYFSWARDAIVKNGCKTQTKLGSFDSTADMEYFVERGDTSFVIDQFQELQGWAPVLFATLYLTTGVLPLAPPGKGGVYISGTSLVTQKNFVENTKTRENMIIGGVLHGTTTDTFWDAVFSAARQSAIDMDIDLILDRFDPQQNDLVLYKEMAKEIRSLCASGVDGLFVTLPDDIVVDAVRDCKEVNPKVQIISINAGYERSKELNLIHHIGMEDRDAGHEAGVKMVEMAQFDKALCLNHLPGLPVLDDRCEGFGQAMNDKGIEYLGQVELRDDDISRTIDMVEEELYEDGDWDGYGILLVGLSQLPAALELKKLHPGVVIGTFDTNDVLHKSLETGDILFGIDQQPYLQGHLPIPILKYSVIEKQRFLHNHIKSGPKFVIFPPHSVTANCAARNFPVCLTEEEPFPTESPTVTGHPSASIQPSAFPTVQPSASMLPSFLPTFDLRPTLEIVQARGNVRCGLKSTHIDDEDRYAVKLCRAIAAVVLGNPDKIDQIPLTGEERFITLNDRDVDLLLWGDTHTIEREVREQTTGAGFTFSSPYYYDGLAYYGTETFVDCAEKEQRYGHCSSLRICVLEGTSNQEFLESTFPSNFIFPSSWMDLESRIKNGTCNAFAGDRSGLLVIKTWGIYPKELVLGNKLRTKEPLAIVTRNSDREFSDVINWVVQGLYYGEEQGLTRNSSLCQNYKSLTSLVSDLNFMNGVYCVGNYGEIIFGDRYLTAEESNRGMNQINDGGNGMLYATPFGELGREGNFPPDLDITSGTLLDDIRKRERLNCGVIVPNGSDEQLIEDGNKLFGMSIDYCHTLAAAIFYGESNSVTLTSYSESDNGGFDALNNGVIDVLAGARVHKKYDFGGFHFSTPYFYGNETDIGDLNMFSFATRDGDVVFASFANTIILATMYAQESGVASKQMPFMSIFGFDLGWALKDAIQYSGSYGDMYSRNFDNVEEEKRGRNVLNNNGGPQIHSFPGLFP